MHRHLRRAVALVFLFGLSCGTAGASSPGPDPLAAIAAAVEAGQANAPIPSVTTPALTAVAGSGADLGACSGFRKTRSKICNYGDARGTHTMVIFGNSHAAMWVPGLSVIAKQSGWKLYPVVKEACAYEIYVNLNHQWGVDNQCSVWYRWAMTVIEHLHPNVIIIGSYDATPQWGSGERVIAQAMRKLAPRVILLSDDVHTPAPGGCLSANGATQGTCLYREPAKAVTEAQMASNVARVAGVQYLDVTNLTCDAGLCPAVIDGIIPTKDGAHLTVEYSTFIASALANGLNLGGANTVPIVGVPLSSVGGATTTTTVGPGTTTTVPGTTTTVPGTTTTTGAG